MDTLPFKGVYVSASYSISNNTITVIMDENNEALANQEFDELLRKNGIQERSWIVDLVIRNE